jgi:GNAT superfamily N-acetyltransferase
MDDERLRREMAEVHAVLDPAGAEVGLVELDFRAPGECLIRFLGLVPELAGKGHGAWLFAQTLALAWRPGSAGPCQHLLARPSGRARRLSQGRLHRLQKRAFESFPDPRLAGLLPSDCAPQLPLIGGGG